MNSYPVSYEVHYHNEEEYSYLIEVDICITITSSCHDYPLYLDLEENGEFTLSFYKWHTHYFGEEQEFDCLCQDLIDILENKKCDLVELSSTTYDLSSLCNTLPSEFQKELQEGNETTEQVYWTKKL